MMNFIIPFIRKAQSTSDKHMNKLLGMIQSLCSYVDRQQQSHDASLENFAKMREELQQLYGKKTCFLLVFLNSNIKSF